MQEEEEEFYSVSVSICLFKQQTRKLVYVKNGENMHTHTLCFHAL